MENISNVGVQKKIQTPTASAALEPERFINFLMQSSQVLWSKSSLEALVRQFIELQREYPGLTRFNFMKLMLQNNKLTWAENPLDIEGIEKLDPDLMSALEKSLLKLDLGGQEYQLGLNSYFCQNRDLFFVLIGDPLTNWDMVIWETPNKFNSQESQTMLGSVVPAKKIGQPLSGSAELFLVCEFLSLQFQHSAKWFTRLDKTQALLYKDDLTGTHNIRYLDAALDTEIRRSQRFQTGFCLLFIDLDGFKGINDTHGHLSGSAVLKQLGDLLKSTMREIDSVVRYGGDEFVILLLGANADTGLLAAERIRKKIEQMPFHLDNGHSAFLTASIGVAAYPEHAKDKKSLLRLADETMYAGKRGGKNKVMIVSLGSETKAKEYSDLADSISTK